MTTSDGSEAPVATASNPADVDVRPWPGRLTRPGSRARRMVIAATMYVLCAGVFAAVAGLPRLDEHTAFNHYALLANAWLHGRQDLPSGPPVYTQNNDFAEYRGKTYISFPPLPAALMVPFVFLAGSAEDFRDGQFVILLAGLAPSFLFLALEKLRRTARSCRSERENAILALLFAFGSVYFFTAVEGTVWFAALVVAASLQALYVLFALDAEQPLLAGAMIGCAWLTRPTMAAGSVLFALEALRVSVRGGLAAEGSWMERLRSAVARIDARALGRRYLAFAAPILVAFAIVAWMNWTRYGRATPIYFDHELLTVGWHERIHKWGLASYHFLGKNMGIALASLPWLPPKGQEAAFGAPFKINEHGLALWFTTPLYFWLIWPKPFERENDRKWLYAIVAISAAIPAATDLLYQNSGWRQFGYRFSGDYAVLLFVLLAIGARPMRGLFAAAAVWSVVWNSFGAATFDKATFDRFYFRDGSQTIVFQPD